MVPRHRRSWESYSGRGVLFNPNVLHEVCFPVRKPGTRTVVIVPCIPRHSVHLVWDALIHHIDWSLRAPVQGLYVSLSDRRGTPKTETEEKAQNDKKTRNHVTFPVATWILHVTCDVTNVTFNVTYFINRRIFFNMDA